VRGALQEQVEAIAPQGWTLGLDNFSLGDVAPSISGFQARAPVPSLSIFSADMSVVSFKRYF
jgi:hypothetical protein